MLIIQLEVEFCPLEEATILDLVDKLSKKTEFFKVATSEDGLIGYVPKDHPISKEVSKWTIAQCNAYLQSLEYQVEISEKDFEILRSHASRGLNYFTKDFPILRGESPKTPQPARTEWLNQEPIPIDHCVAGKPFLRVFEPQPAAPGRSVKGDPINPQMGSEEQELVPLSLKLPPEFAMEDGGFIVSNKSGRVTMEAEALTFKPVYEIKSTELADYQKAEFHCDVEVKGDVEGQITWKVFGKLTIQGHLSVSTIEIHGDLQADSGIQTNMSGVLKVYGNVRATYIQLSKVGILGDVLIETGIILSEVRIGGSLFCRGTPGAIIGSKVHCYGAITANKVGSDRGRNTHIHVCARDPDAKKPKTRIGLLCAGTFMQVYENTWIQREDLPYETEIQS